MEQLVLFDDYDKEYLTLKEAGKWASKYLNRNITVSNISYLIQYGLINKHTANGRILIAVADLKRYYDRFNEANGNDNNLVDGLNWNLSFSQYKESERTKHVHRLHPYKGKFIPQLVEYFLDDHTDAYKDKVYFSPGDIVLDPFCGSGTTLVQCNELGMHAIGIDISEFNSIISNTKISTYNFKILKKTLYYLTNKLNMLNLQRDTSRFDSHLIRELTKFNNKYFPSPEYRRKVREKTINEPVYAKQKEEEFLQVYNKLVEDYQINLIQDESDTFLGKWFLLPVRKEIDYMLKLFKDIQDQELRTILTLILSRTVRSCRATTHADLGTLKEPVTTTYYCRKHGKICKPLMTTKGWWQRYAADTINRLEKYAAIRTDTQQICLTGDSRKIDLTRELNKEKPDLAKLVGQKKISGIFSSPPYVGLIDYHEQHAYSYELFGLQRQDSLEIGPLSKGQGQEARTKYVKDIAETLNNCKKYLKKDHNVFLVANDKYSLYPRIAQLAGMTIVNSFKRPVLNRVEKNRNNIYSETIFHLKEK